MRNDRKFSSVGRSTGGGVLFATLNNYNFQQIDTTHISNLVPLVDIIMCKYVTNATTIFFITVYVPPDISSADMFSFTEALTPMLLEHSVFIIGDLNLPHFSLDPDRHIACAKTRCFIDFCNLLNLTQLMVLLIAITISWT